MHPNEIILTFRTQYKTYIGQQLFVIGNQPFLGNWSRQNALRMHYLTGNDETFNWAAQISFPISKNCPIKIEYKYIVLTSYSSNGQRYQQDIRFDKNAEIVWDAGPNRTLIIQNDGSSPLSITTGDLFQPSISNIEHIFFKKPCVDIIYSATCNNTDYIISSQSLNSQ